MAFAIVTNIHISRLSTEHMKWIKTYCILFYALLICTDA